MLQPFADNIWLADGPVVTAALGFRYPTRMAVIRLAAGDLVIWSPVALDEGLRAAVDALGPVAHLIAPNALHDSFLADWIAAYRTARVHLAPRLGAKRPDIAFADTLTETPAIAWANEIDQVLVENRIAPEIVFFHRASATVFVTDIIQQLPLGWYRGWRGLVARLDLMTASEPSVPRKFRLAIGSGTAARAAVARIRAWPAERLVFAHGQPVAANAKGALARAFRWLKPQAGSTSA